MAGRLTSKTAIDIKTKGFFKVRSFKVHIHKRKRPKMNENWKTQVVIKNKKANRAEE